MAESERVDKWLWSVRVFKTRTAANTACTEGRVKINDVRAKPATKVIVGDTIVARRGAQVITYRVNRLISKRVSASAASECYEDLTPPDAGLGARARVSRRSDLGIVEGGTRDRGAGRPTKRERRQIDKLRGR